MAADADPPPPAPDEAVQHHLRVERTARYYTLAPLAAEPVETWFVLHGYRQAAARFLRRFVALRAPGRDVIAPEGLSRFYVDPAPGRHGPEHRVGASWMTREDRESEIRDYVDYLDALAGSVGAGRSEGARRVVLGFSQGAHTATRWAVRGKETPHHLVLWGTGLPGDLSRDELSRGLAAVRVTLVRGATDRFRSPAGEDAEEALLEELGVEWRVVEFQGGHEVHEAPLLRIAEDIRAPER